MSITNNITNKLPSRAWLIVGLLWVVGCLNYLDRIMLTTMRGSIIEAIPMTDAQFGLLTSVFLWVYACLSPLGGFMADRFSRSRVIIVSLFVWSFVTWLTGHAQNFEQLLIARALMGISEACYIPAALALISDYHRGPTRSLATGIHMTGVFAGQGLGGLGGVIAEQYSWSTPFVVFGVFGVVYAGVLIMFMRDPSGDTAGADLPAANANAAAAGKPAGPNLLEAVASLFSKPAFWLALGFWGLLGFANWVVLAWTPTYFSTHFNLSQGAAGMSATAYMQIAAFGGVIFGGWWADRWSRKNKSARILVPMIGIIISVPAVLLFATTNIFGIALAGLIIFGGVRCFADANMMPILCIVVDERYRATGYGFLNFFACAVGGIAIYLGGVMRDAQINIGVVFVIGACGLAVCAALLACLKGVAQKG